MGRTPRSLEALLPLPGVVNDQSMVLFSPEDDWPAISQVLQRRWKWPRCGFAKARPWPMTCRPIAAPSPPAWKRSSGGRRWSWTPIAARLEERLNKVLSEYQVTLDPADIIREVSLYADRGDISEEIVRLKSHLEQFDSIMQLPESSGRKLEFLTQELFREANTIGSKASDVEIAKQVIEIKTAIERIREMIQNIE